MSQVPFACKHAEIGMPVDMKRHHVFPTSYFSWWPFNTLPPWASIKLGGNLSPCETPELSRGLEKKKVTGAPTG